MARPSEFTPEIADEICELLADGISLREICEAETMPDRSTVRRWRNQSAEFRAQYARAREEQAHVYAERVVEVAQNAEDAQLARLEMDALKWAASKLAPKDYGDKVAHVGGDEGDAPIKTSLTVTFV